MDSFAKFLPSKHFRGVLLSVVFSCLAVSIAYAINDNKKPAEMTAPKLIVEETGNAKTSNYDWLSSLQEVASSSGVALTEAAVKITNTKQLTATDILARDLFSKYVAASRDQNGNDASDIDTKTEGDIIASVLKTHDEITIKPRLYTKGDLTIVSDDSREIVKSYGNAMGSIIKTNLRQNVIELDVLNNALKNNNESELKKLDPVINNYQNMLDQSLKVGVPEIATQSHLEFLNAISTIVTSLKVFRNTFKDPSSSALYVGIYPQAAKELRRAFSDARNLFSRNTVTFDNSVEDGNYYAHFIDLIEEAEKNIKQK